MNLLVQNEASRVYDGVLSCRQNLRADHADSKPPWSNNQFTESALRDAVDKIWKNASKSTAVYYRRGKPGGENWVIRWMLYHVCRYRDSRNKKAARSQNFHDDDGLFGPPGKSSTGMDAKRDEADCLARTRRSKRTGRFREEDI